MDISMSGLIAQILNFAILFFLFKKFLTKPIVEALEERKNLIRKLKKADKKYAEKLKQAEEESHEIVAKARKIKEHIVADAGILAEKKRISIIKDANEHAERIVKDANAKVENMRKNLALSFEESVKKTSSLVLKKLVKDQKELETSYIKERIAELEHTV